jgi:hypothetical protein
MIYRRPEPRRPESAQPTSTHPPPELHARPDPIPELAALSVIRADRAQPHQARNNRQIRPLAEPRPVNGHLSWLYYLIIEFDLLRVLRTESERGDDPLLLTRASAGRAEDVQHNAARQHDADDGRPTEGSRSQFPKSRHETDSCSDPADVRAEMRDLPTSAPVQPQVRCRVQTCQQERVGSPVHAGLSLRSSVHGVSMTHPRMGRARPPCFSRPARIRRGRRTRG